MPKTKLTSDQIQAQIKESHQRAKSKLVASAATGGFHITRRHAK